MGYEAFGVGVSGGVGHTTLDQPERGDPFEGPSCHELSPIAAECDEPTEVRAVLIDAAGRTISVGAAPRVPGRDRNDLPGSTKAATAGLHSAIARLVRMETPVVAAVTGSPSRAPSPSRRPGDPPAGKVGEP